MSSSSLILAYDVTGSQDSIALGMFEDTRSGPILLPPIHSTNFYTSSPRVNSQRQSSRLVPDLQELLATHGQTFKNIQVLCTLIGPGSFTGIRIGLATAQGITLAHPCTVFAPTTLELLLFIGETLLGSENTSLTAIIDSGRGDFFALKASDQEATILSKEEILKRQAAQEKLISLTSIADIGCLLPPHPLSHHLIEYYMNCAPETRHSRQALTPFYIRHPEFKEKTPCLPLPSLS